MATELTPNKPADASRDLISLAEAAKMSGLSPGHLRLLVRRGSIWGIKIGRNWVTSAVAVHTYLSLNRRPGPKPKRQTEK